MSVAPFVTLLLLIAALGTQGIEWHWNSPVSADFASANWNGTSCCPAPTDVARLLATGGPFTVTIAVTTNVSAVSIGSVTSDSFGVLNIQGQNTLHLTQSPQCVQVFFGAALRLAAGGSISSSANAASTISIHSGGIFNVQDDPVLSSIESSISAVGSGSLTLDLSNNATLSFTGREGSRVPFTASDVSTNFQQGSTLLSEYGNVVFNRGSHSASNIRMTFRESKFYWQDGSTLQFERVDMIFSGSSNSSEVAYDEALATDVELLDSSTLRIIDSNMVLGQNGWFELYSSSTLESLRTNISVVGKNSYFGITNSDWTCGDSQTSSDCGTIYLDNLGYLRLRGSNTVLNSVVVEVLGGSDFFVSANSNVTIIGGINIVGSDTRSYVRLDDRAFLNVTQSIVTGEEGFFTCDDASMYVGGDFITTGFFEPTKCNITFDGAFNITTGRIIFDQTNLLITNSSYVGPGSIFNADYGSIRLEGDLLVEDGTWIANTTQTTITGSIRTGNCKGASRETTIAFLGYTWEVFDVARNYTSCLLGIDATDLRILSGGINLAPSTPMRIYLSNVFVNASIIAESNSSATIDVANVTFGPGASMKHAENVVFECWYGTQLYLEGGSVEMIGDDRDPEPDYPGLAFFRGSGITVNSGQIILTRRVYLIWGSRSTFQLRGGNILSNHGVVLVRNSTGSIEGGSLLLTNSSSMYIYLNASMSISGGDVILTNSYLEIDESTLRVTGSVRLRNASSIAVFAYGILDVNNGTILTSGDSFVELLDKGGPGILQGSGRIAGRVENRGGRITFNNGSTEGTYLNVEQYTQGRNGTFEVVVSPRYESGISTVINATGDIQLSGTVVVTIDSEAAERLRSAGASGVTLLTSTGGSITGAFDKIDIKTNSAESCQYRISQTSRSLSLIFDQSGCAAPTLPDSALSGGAIAGIAIAVFVVASAALLATFLLVPSLRVKFFPALESARRLKMLKAQQAVHLYRETREAELKPTNML